MIVLLILVVILGVMCWALCEMVSTIVGIVFVIAAMLFLIRMAKQVFK